MFRKKQTDALPDAQAEAGQKAAAGSKADKFSEANHWEARHVQNVEASERKAWRIAYLALFSSVLPWVAIVGMMPLKESVPYVIKENAQGAATLLTRVNWADIGYDEARDKHWAARYVITRERYDWNTLQEDYDLTLLLSSGDVGKEYNALYSGDDSRDKQMGDRSRVKVRVISVVPSKSGSATIRYITEKNAPDGSGRPEVRAFVATVAYEYVENSTLTEDKRLLNPFGFRVTSYRNDSEQYPGGL